MTNGIEATSLFQKMASLQLDERQAKLLAKIIDAAMNEAWNAALKEAMKKVVKA